MKLLKDLLYTVPLLNTHGSTHLAVAKICFDSREVVRESLFVAVSGTKTNGHQYIDQAISAGARSVVCEHLPETLKEGVSYLQVRNSAKALGILAANFYDHPSQKLKLVAVTGTNGKTTVASLLYQLFRLLGYKSGLLSTVEIKINQRSLPATHTTPDPLYLNQCLREMVDSGVQYCFMEASSHGIHQERMAGLQLAGAIFTNLSHDHLDYHGSFENYLKAKKKLFDELPRSAFALVNADDRHGDTMLQHCPARSFRFATKTEADFKGRLLEHQFDGMLLRLNGQEVWTKLIGHFNASNLTAIYAAAELLGQDSLQIATAISSLQPVAGRFQYLRSEGGPIAIVDYAHTPDALENVLQTLQQIRQGNEMLITVVGCGGNRDREKRAPMARIAMQYSDQVIFTADNPRFEAPEAIIQEMVAGLPMGSPQNYLQITDRREAIKTALTLAKEGDLVLIAGKGHEKYQEIKGEKHPFDDLDTARTFMAKSKT